MNARLPAVAALLLAGAATTPGTAQAQVRADDVVVMRRAVTRPQPRRDPVPTQTPTPGTPTPTAAPAAWAYGDWTVTTPSTCGERTLERSASCLRGGVPADQAQCGDREEVQRTEEVTTGCAYRWSVGEYAPLNQCSPSLVRTRSVACQWLHWRGERYVEDESGCAAVEARPRTDADPVSDTSGCTGKWTQGAWTDAGSCVGGRRAQTNTPTCMVGGAPADAFQCSNDTAPATTRQVDCGQNLLGNGGFDSLSSWTTAGTVTATTLNGNTVARLVSPNASTIAAITQDVQVVKDRTYRLEINSYLENGSYCTYPTTMSGLAGGIQKFTSTHNQCTANPSDIKAVDWKADFTGTLTVRIKVGAQQSYQTMLLINTASFSEK